MIEKTSLFFRINKFLFTLISIQFIFNSIFIRLGVRELVFYTLAFSFILNISLVLLQRGYFVNNTLLICFPFITWGIFKLIISYLTESNIVFTIAGVGFIGTFFYLIHWLIIINTFTEYDFGQFIQYVAEAIYYLGIITAVFAIYQYYFDQSLFSTNKHIHYGDYSLIESGIITKRATAFIGSPQALGFFLYVVFVFAIFKSQIIKTKIVSLMIICIAGLLSGSSAFVGSLFAFLVIYSIKEFKKKFSRKKYFLFITVIIFVTIMYYVSTSLFIDVSYLNALNWDITQHLPFYYQFLTMYKFDDLVLGHGLGLTDRLVEVFFKFIPPSVWKPSNESYLLKIFYEIGIIGLISFFMIFHKSIKNSFRYNDRYSVFWGSLIIGILVNLAFTPSFSGLTQSFIIWPLILIPFLNKANLKFD